MRRLNIITAAYDIYNQNCIKICSFWEENIHLIKYNTYHITLIGFKNDRSFASDRLFLFLPLLG